MTRRLHLTAARAAALVPVALALFAGQLTVASAADAPPTAPAAEPGATADPELATFGLTSSSGGVPDSRSFIEVGGAPGSVINDAIAVVNQSDAALDLDVYAADAVTDANGAIGLTQRATKTTEAGTWITLGSEVVNVPPQSDRGIGYTVVPLSVTIPSDAEPGDHLAGVVASLTSSSTTDGDRQATVDLEQRIGLRVYVNVSGEQTPSLAVTNVRGTYAQGKAFGLAGAGTMTVIYTLTNDGNVRVGVEPEIRVSGPFGLLARTVDGESIDELLPGTSVEQTVTMPNVWPMVFDPITVSATAVAAIGRDDPAIGTVTGSGHGWAVPWALLVVVLLVVGGWSYLRHRRRVGDSGTPPRDAHRTGTPGPPGTPPGASTPTDPTSPTEAPTPQAVPQ